MYPHRDTSSPPIAKVPPPRNDSFADKEDPEEDAKTIYNDCIASYTARCVIDTTFTMGIDRYVLHSGHICLMDSAITVPNGYVSYQNLDSFVTHNFITNVELTKNGRQILKTTIHKNDFGDLLFPALKKYAVLFCPHLRLDKTDIWLEYSISIPLTDVGKAAYVKIDKDGNLSFTDRQ